MPPYLINPQQMLRRGLRAVNIDDVKQQRRLSKTNLADFMSIYGKHPLHLCRLWRALQTHADIAHPMSFQEARTKDAFEGFLFANNFLRTYTTNAVQAALFNGADRTRVGRLKWIYIEKIACLKPVKIVWPENFDETFIASVDGTHAQTTEPRDAQYRKNSKNYSHKFHMPGRNFELVIDLWRNRCISAKVSDRASAHDLTAFRAQLKNLIPAGKRVIADKGYISQQNGDHLQLATPNPLDSEEVKAFKSKARARHEKFNALLKIYLCLTKRFTQGIDKLQLCFDAVLVITQFAIEDEGPHGQNLMIM